MTDAGEPDPPLSNLKTHVFSVSETKETSKTSCFRFLRNGTDSLPTQSDWQKQNEPLQRAQYNLRGRNSDLNRTGRGG